MDGLNFINSKETTYVRAWKHSLTQNYTAV